MGASRNKQAANPPAPRLLDTLRSSLAGVVPQGETLTVGFSGGHDSTVLLDVLSLLLPPSRLQVLHIHHGLSPVANEWAAFCQSFAQERGLSCQVIRVCPEQKAGKGIEAAARAARYAAFSQYGGRWLVLAHHMGDQAETLLLNLFRGAGLNGLAAMSQLSRRGQQWLWRPLLDVPRSELQQYADQRSLVWIEDESNANPSYRRNFLRHGISPLLETRFPGMQRVLARAASHVQEALFLLEERAKEDFLACRLGDAAEALSLDHLKALSRPRQANLLRYWLRSAVCQAPETRTLSSWLIQLANADRDTPLRLSYPEGELRLWRGGLYRLPVRYVLPNACQIGIEELMSGHAQPRREGQMSWWYEPAVDFPSDQQAHQEQRMLLQFNAVMLEEALASGKHLRLAARAGGESILLAGKNGHARSLKKWAQELGLAPWQREYLPLLWIGDELIACFGLGVACHWSPANGDPTWVFRWDSEASKNRNL